MRVSLPPIVSSICITRLEANLLVLLCFHFPIERRTLIIVSSHASALTARLCLGCYLKRRSAVMII